MRIDNKVADLTVNPATTLKDIRQEIHSNFSGSGIRGMNFFTADGIELALSSKMSNLMQSPYFQISIEFDQGKQEYDVLSSNSLRRTTITNQLDPCSLPLFKQSKELGLNDMNAHALTRFEHTLLHQM